MMDQARFAQILEAYGGEPDRWPAAERSAAEAFGASSAEARALWAQARRLDSLLDAWSPAAASAGLTARIAASAPSSRTVEPKSDRPALAWTKARATRLWWAGAALAASWALGMLAGAHLARTDLFQPAASDAQPVAMASSDKLAVFESTLDLGKGS
jgi:hypothetical protein